MPSPLHQIGVLGGGLMGHGIALIFAQAGHTVSVYDPEQSTRDSLPARIRTSQELLGKSAQQIDETLTKVTATDTIKGCVEGADFVFEAAPEKLPLKQTLFATVEEHATSSAVLASNTSVIQISKIMANLSNQHRALGTHWWNPPHQIPLVEIIKTPWTDDDSVQSMFALLKSVGKTPVVVEKDVPGFIGNRLQHALWREAVSLVENGVCTAEAVDDVVKASFGRRLSVLGPLENADLVGIELTQDIHRQVLFDLESSGEPSPYLQKLLDDKRSGMVEGAGFREYESDDVAKTKARVSEHLIKLEAILPD